MKFINKYISAVALGAILLSSCNDELNVSSPSQMDGPMVYSTIENATNAINGVYVLFCEDPFTSRMSAVWMQNTDVEASAPSAGAPGNDRRAVWSLQSPAIIGFNDVYNAWNNRLQAINRANMIIEGINASAIANDAEMQQIKGEAICLKAYSYYLMCGFWGDVPLWNESAKWGMELDRPRTDKNIIYTSILKELIDIEPKMKFSDVNTGGIERMNRDFALGLIARIAMFRAGYGKTADNQMKRADDYLDVNSDELSVTYTDNNGNSVTAHTYLDYYQLAKDYCQKLISLKGRDLCDDFNTPFLNENTYTVVNNSEVLYEVAFVETFGGDVGWCIGVANTGSCAQGTTTAQVGLTPTYYMSFADNDSRREVTCANYAHANDTVNVTRATGIGIAKWDRALASKNLGSGSSKGTGINWPLMRYSDVLLMLAEAENEINGPTEIAKSALTEVRARAFTNSPEYGKDVTEYVDSVAENPQKFFNAIVDERAWEFGGEGLRRFDLIRWNLYAQKIEKAMHDMLCWGIATNEDLMNDQTVTKKFPDAANFKNWADRLYYKKTGKTNTRNDVTWLNKKYKADETEIDGWQYTNWGSDLIKRVRTYMYENEEYTACTKVTDPTTGEVTYELGVAPAIKKIVISAGTPSNITRVDKYTACDYATRIYRGYSNGAITGNGKVPFLLPIAGTTLSSSTALSNDGYGINDADMGEGINTIVGTIIKENF